MPRNLTQQALRNLDDMRGMEFQTERVPGYPKLNRRSDTRVEIWIRRLRLAKKWYAKDGVHWVAADFKVVWKRL